MFFNLRRMIRHRIINRLLMIALLSFCQGLVADDEVTVSFNNADILDVIRWASDLTDKNIIVSETVKSKRVTVIAGDPMSKKEAYETFLSILQVNGLAAVEAEGSLKIFAVQDAKSNAIPLIDDANASDEDIVIRIVRIKNIAATQLLALLRPLVPATAAFEVHADTNILLIADSKANIQKIVSLVEKIDKAGTIDIEVIPLKHASAKDVVTLVSSLMPKIVGAGKDASTAQAINFAADERSNSILISGDPVMRTQIKNLIERIDQPLEGAGNTQVIYLNYADAKDMAEDLEAISGAVISTDKDKKTTTTKEGEASIVASEANNALVITASPAMLNTMKDVIAKLDVRREQVLVEALLVEVSEEVGRQLGMLGISTADGGFTGVKAGGTFDPAGNISITPGTPATTTSLATTPSASGAGLLLSYFERGNLMGVLSALETMSESNVLSTPTIMALDNEEAEILVGENVPFKTGQQNRTSSTSTTDVSDFVSIERQDIGIHLKVKPKINLNDTLTLEIEQKVESIKETSTTGAADIITDKRELKTKAVIKDNEILVLGGLIRDEAGEIETKVPFLGDIPVIGWLFKGTKKTMVKKNLMVFIHPKIMRNSEENRDISVNRYQDMRGLQEFYNKNTDFLTIRRSKPLLKELPSDMINPDSSPAKESSAADVITVKKEEVTLPTEEPITPPVETPTSDIEKIKPDTAPDDHSTIKVEAPKPKSKKPVVFKPPTRIISKPETKINVPSNEAPTVPPVAPQASDAAKVTTEEKPSTIITEPSAAVVQPEAPIETPATAPVVQ